MPVPASINDLSTTAGNNSPAGSESPTTTDDYLRTLSAFIATLRDGKQPIDPLLTAVAALATGNGQFLAFTGTDTVAVRNIVGTVSQASGIPTGAIIETITNASGVAIRFANGTQICMRDVTTTSTSTPTVATWAAEFVGDYRISYGPTGAATNIVNVKWTSKAATSASFVGVTTTSSGNQTYFAATSDLIAIGRWY